MVKSTQEELTQLIKAKNELIAKLKTQGKTLDDFFMLIELMHGDPSLPKFETTKEELNTIEKQLIGNIGKSILLNVCYSIESQYQIGFGVTDEGNEFIDFSRNYDIYYLAVLTNENLIFDFQNLIISLPVEKVKKHKYDSGGFNDHNLDSFSFKLQDTPAFPPLLFANSGKGRKYFNQFDVYNLEQSYSEDIITIRSTKQMFFAAEADQFVSQKELFAKLVKMSPEEREKELKQLT